LVKKKKRTHKDRPDQGNVAPPKETYIRKAKILKKDKSTSVIEAKKP
jgi:hypothetical protein